MVVWVGTQIGDREGRRVADLDVLVVEKGAEQRQAAGLHQRGVVRLRTCGK